MPYNTPPAVLSIAPEFDYKQSARLSTVANDTLSGLAARDGVTPVAGDRVLVLAQTLGQNNGIYIAAAGAWARSPDADTSAEVTNGMTVFVASGTVNGAKTFTLITADPIVLGTTALVFAQTGGGVTGVAGTAPIQVTGTTTPVVSIVPATTSVPGSMSAAQVTAHNALVVAAPAQAEQVVSTSTATVSANTTRVRVTYSGGGCTLTFASGYTAGARCQVFKENTSTNTIAIVPPSGGTINGAAADASMVLPGSFLASSTTEADPCWEVRFNDASTLRVS